ncbi:MAG: IS630 family transposase [Chryseotalea sp. WA131a]|jgi:transposase|nr:MAG: IS630 family transposase [Chryseotalea sp. WA131a]UXE66301.1 MAG: IS630 family transposase [Chryseotalea sp. WA131a]UXE66567.1 MAG: IS630 family transposase [Chryseotalea sp. WA131a]UXE66921.1 MAG: IS630 family transposase [Chryseotalea sp. WA131a]UXE67378.1 MAG: IS630 family transposase [Chryseotalea sp. WA131a]
MAINKNNDLRFEDECHFQQHGSRCKMWFPPEDKDPVLLHAPTRKTISLFGVVSASTGQMTTMLTKVFNAMTFLAFLKKVLKTRKRGKKLIVVLDNARYHHAILLKSWLSENQDKIGLMFLPPYSPDLNNIERVWKITRRKCTHNKYFSTLGEVELIIKKQMKEWGKPNETIHKLCCII